MNLVAQGFGPNGFGNYVVEWGGGMTWTPTDASPSHLIVPGFVDLHIHGAFGYDFMDSSTLELDALCGNLSDCGYEGLLATTVTAPVAEVEAAISRLPANPMLLGVHIEGPFISPRHPGAQPPESILPAEQAGLWEAVLTGPQVQVVTMAPETEGGMALLDKLIRAGKSVSVGHTDATEAQARLAFDHGSTRATHTFNAMRGFHHREPGTVGAALTDDRVYCEAIYDRVHVSRAAMDLLLRAKGPDKVVAVSDSTRATGLAPGARLKMWGHDCIVGEDSVRLASNGALAGSTVTLLDVFQNLCADFGAQTAIQTCSLSPRDSLGGLPVRKWLLFDSGLQLLEAQAC